MLCAWNRLEKHSLLADKLNEFWKNLELQFCSDFQHICYIQSIQCTSIIFHWILSKAYIMVACVNVRVCACV